jgi:peptidoglycan/LPS O-acetylase OafA/YrhL
MSPARVPEFDGLRAVAVSMVILDHAFRQAAFTGGFIGVDIFFVLSGYLITTLLITENEETGRISLLKFYARRALRLIPALWLVLGFCVLTQVFSAHAAEHIQLIGAAALYVMNWVRAFEISSGWIVGHTWSLAIEEQFYLVWAPLLILALSFGPMALPWVAGVCFILSTLCCLFLSLSGSSPERIYNGFDTRSSALFMGCLLALVPLSESVRHWAARRWLVPIAVLSAVLIGLESKSPILGLGGYQVIALMAAWLILAARGNSYLGATLRHQWLVYLGRISYGIYLWHFVFFELLVSHCTAIVSALIVIPMTIIFAAGSFELVERRFLMVSARRFSPFSATVPSARGVMAQAGILPFRTKRPIV